jgi:hypothetical protein
LKRLIHQERLFILLSIKNYEEISQDKYTIKYKVRQEAIA